MRKRIDLSKPGSTARDLGTILAFTVHGDEVNYFARYLGFLVNAKVHAEKFPSVAREVDVVACSEGESCPGSELAGSAFDVKHVEIAAWLPYFSVRVRSLRRSCCKPRGDIALQLHGVWLHCMAPCTRQIC